jgi:hypothetical protein
LRRLLKITKKSLRTNDPPEPGCGFPGKGCACWKRYVFDNTIYRGDSSVDFFRHCAAKYPSAYLSAVAAAPWFAAMVLGLAEKTRVRSAFIAIFGMAGCSRRGTALLLTHDKNLKDWYFAQMRRTT